MCLVGPPGTEPRSQTDNDETRESLVYQRNSTNVTLSRLVAPHQLEQIKMKDLPPSKCTVEVKPPVKDNGLLQSSTRAHWRPRRIKHSYFADYWEQSSDETGSDCGDDDDTYSPSKDIKECSATSTGSLDWISTGSLTEDRKATVSELSDSITLAPQINHNERLSLYTSNQTSSREGSFDEQEVNSKSLTRTPSPPTLHNGTPTPPHTQHNVSPTSSHTPHDVHNSHTHTHTQHNVTPTPPLHTLYRNLLLHHTPALMKVPVQ